jgi:hypothetical protein
MQKRRVILWSVVVAVIAAGLFRPLWLTAPPWSRTDTGGGWADVFGRSVVAQLTTAVLTAAAAIGGYLWVRSSRERPPEFAPQFAPPTGLGPAQCEYIRAKFIANVPAVVSTVYDLASRKFVALTQGDDTNWTIRGLVDESRWGSLDPASRALGDVLKLDAPAAEFTVDITSRAGQRLAEAAERVRHSLLQWALAEGLVVRRYSHYLFEAAGIGAMTLAVWLFFWPREPAHPLHATMWGLPAAVFVLVTGRLWQRGTSFRRTAEGRELWSRVGGFHRVLVTDSPETRVDFTARDEPYTKYIPYAAAAGAAELWGEKYIAATGEPALLPHWYQAANFPGGRVYPFKYAVSASIFTYASG